MCCSNITYGVAPISRLLKIKGLFCRILSVLWDSFAIETCNFKEPTNRSHPIVRLLTNELRDKTIELTFATVYQYGGIDFFFYV